VSTTTVPSSPARADVTVASSAANAAAVAAVERHHAELAARLTAHVAAMLVAAGDPEAFAPTRAAAGAFCTGELAPHAAAEEQVLYPAAAAAEAARLLVEGMVAEHAVIHRLVTELTVEPDPVRAAASAYALKVLFDAHLAKENELVLPVVAADPSISLAGILAGMHELLGPDEHDEAGPAAQAGCGCGGCDCGS
jgi:iron-sulfur cluster repair protein YtfE (RIC family)